MCSQKVRAHCRGQWDSTLPSNADSLQGLCTHAGLLRGGRRGAGVWPSLLNTPSHQAGHQLGWHLGSRGWSSTVYHAAVPGHGCSGAAQACWTASRRAAWRWRRARPARRAWSPSAARTRWPTGSRAWSATRAPRGRRPRCASCWRPSPTCTAAAWCGARPGDVPDLRFEVLGFKGVWCSVLRAHECYLLPPTCTAASCRVGAKTLMW